MNWIWQRVNWPLFSYDTTRFTYIEREFHRNAGLIIGTLTAIPFSHPSKNSWGCKRMEEDPGQRKQAFPR